MRNDAPGFSGPWGLAGDRRHCGRVHQDNLACSIGHVMDLSAEGMRVLCDRPPDGDVDVVFDYRGADLVIRARPMWSKPYEPGRHEVGLRFLGADRLLIQRLWNVSLSVRLKPARPS